ncbi:hypothetical protein [Echinimonas agarilytica]|uniref:Uncharacterized protein n=1 Tax=Echinimonas agarilytica TaxID=1215918 RepID=A0AA42B7Y3_9GAMM|nr:hypothetical protein [Echinimonas agarilytica]MCM2680347.1 hypothetical protein [Echinimonas agarilytica]
MDVFDNWSESKACHDGSSAGKAIVVMTVAEEADWIDTFYPDSRSVMHAVKVVNSVPYDVHVMRDSKGEEQQLYFDLTYCHR